MQPRSLWPSVMRAVKQPTGTWEGDVTTILQSGLNPLTKAHNCRERTSRVIACPYIWRKRTTDTDEPRTNVVRAETDKRTNLQSNDEVRYRSAICSVHPHHDWYIISMCHVPGGVPRPTLTLICCSMYVEATCHSDKNYMRSSS